MNCRSRIKNKSDCNCSSVHSKVIKMESIKWNLMHDDLAFSQFLWNLKSIFSCSHENLFFEVISYKLITLKALEKCQSECDTHVMRQRNSIIFLLLPLLHFFPCFFSDFSPFIVFTITKLEYFRRLAGDATRKGASHLTKLTEKGYTGHTMK